MSLNNTYSGKDLHVVAFDIPVPVNYGGAIDIFYKLKALKNAGIKIHLHCFEYDREPADELNLYCETVHYYKREINKSHLFKLKPYIVATRNSKELLHNLCSNDYPILFEGLHTCCYLDHNSLKNRLKIVRTHNIEHHYYSNLARVEKDLFKKYYFLNEAAKLKKYEKVLYHAQGIASISKNDFIHFSNKYENVKVISAFHPHDNVNINEGYGSYALYHGSLDVAENNEAAVFLAEKVFSGLDIPFIIAGNKISRELRQLESKYPNITLRTNIKTEEIYDLVRNAHVNILPTFQATGIKLKLLAALYTGRHCIVNTPMVVNTGLEGMCIVADEPEDMKLKLNDIFKFPFSMQEIFQRESVLNHNGFTNQHNILLLLDLLFPNNEAE